MVLGIATNHLLLIVSVFAVRTLKIDALGVIHTNYSLSLPFYLSQPDPVTEGVNVDKKDIKRRWDY